MPAMTETQSDNLLLLSCCAPCSIGVISDLHAAGQRFTVLFYNPNIQPPAEYARRRDENQRVCQALGVPFVELPYDPETWRQATRGLESEPERGRRCDQCFFLRLHQAALYARAHGFTRFDSVLGISRYKDFAQVSRAGQRAASRVGIPYTGTNWRKNGGEAKANRLSREWGLYRQNYCGCHPRPRTPDTPVPTPKATTPSDHDNSAPATDTQK